MVLTDWSGSSNPSFVHGAYGTRTHRRWRQMIRRCKEDPRYFNVKISDRWKEFLNFVADMGECPSGKTLDRFPIRNGNYEPGNCRWATPDEQAQNRRTTRLTPDDVREIRLRAASGETQTSIADDFEITQGHVANVVIRKIWKNIE